MGRRRAGALLCVLVAAGPLVAAVPLASALHWCGPLGISWQYPGLAYPGETKGFAIIVTNGLDQSLALTAITVTFAWEAEPRDWGGMTIPARGVRANTHPITLPSLPQDYTVSISVTGGTNGEPPGVCGPFTKELTVFPLPQPPFVLIAASPFSGPAPLTVSFSANVTEGVRPFTYDWDFGDGNASTEASPRHSYILPGNYNVRVVVTDERARSDWDNATIVVERASPSGPLTVERARNLLEEFGPALGAGTTAAAAWLLGLVILRRRRRTPPRPPPGGTVGYK